MAAKCRVNALLRDVIQKLPEQGLQPEIVFVTGDIAHSGKKEEYHHAFVFFETLAAALNHQPAVQWFVAPGNHDVDQTRIKGIAGVARNTLDEDQVLAPLGPGWTKHQRFGLIPAFPDGHELTATGTITGQYFH